jgi:hypothetical protein
MSEHDPAREEITRYALFLTRGGLVFHLRDEGIAPGRDKISFIDHGKVRIVPYGDLTEVNLTMTAMPRTADVAQMVIRFGNNNRVVVLNTDAWGRADAQRTQEYYRFKADFHARLVAAKAFHIRFTTGASAGRSAVAMAALAVAGALFLLLPLVLFFMTGQPQILLIMLTGALFLWPFWRAANRNQPSTYDPRDPPDMLR